MENLKVLNTQSLATKFPGMERDKLLRYFHPQTRNVFKTVYYEANIHNSLESHTKTMNHMQSYDIDFGHDHCHTRVSSCKILYRLIVGWARQSHNVTSPNYFLNAYSLQIAARNVIMAYSDGFHENLINSFKRGEEIPLSLMLDTSTGKNDFCK